MELCFVVVLDVVNIWRQKLEVAAADYKYTFVNHARQIQAGMTHAVFGVMRWQSSQARLSIGWDACEILTSHHPVLHIHSNPYRKSKSLSMAMMKPPEHIPVYKHLSGQRINK